MNGSYKKWIYLVLFVVLIPFQGSSQITIPIPRYPVTIPNPFTTATSIPITPSNPTTKVFSDTPTTVLVIDSTTIARVREDARKNPTTRSNWVIRYKVSRYFRQILDEKGIPSIKYLSLSKEQELENCMNDGDFEKAVPLINEAFQKMDEAEGLVKKTPTPQATPVPVTAPPILAKISTPPPKQISSLKAAFNFYKPKNISLIEAIRNFDTYNGTTIEWKGDVIENRGDDKYLVTIPEQSSFFLTGINPDQTNLNKNQTITVIGQITKMDHYETQLGIQKTVLIVKVLYVDVK